MFQLLNSRKQIGYLIDVHHIFYSKLATDTHRLTQTFFSADYGREKGAALPRSGDSF